MAGAELDLDLFENVWGMLKQHLRLLSKQPTTCDQLFDVLQSQWDSPSDAYFHSLVATMSSRVHKVIEVRGKSTEY